MEKAATTTPCAARVPPKLETRGQSVGKKMPRTVSPSKTM